VVYVVINVFGLFPSQSIVRYKTVQRSVLCYSTYLLFGSVQNRVAATAAYIGTRGGRRREPVGACRRLEMRPHLILFASN
jgi:hypothetical protein